MQGRVQVRSYFDFFKQLAEQTQIRCWAFCNKDSISSDKPDGLGVRTVFPGALHFHS